jgi:hypothetical protein
MRPDTVKCSHSDCIQVNESNESDLVTLSVTKEVDEGGLVVRCGEECGHVRRTDDCVSSLRVSPSHVLDIQCELVQLTHSCRPSCAVVWREWFADGAGPAGLAGGREGQLHLVALRPLRPGDKLSINYTATEPNMAEPFDCACDDCTQAGRSRRVRGGAFTTLEEMQLLPSWAVAPHVVEARSASERRN